jgi:hypothetical protein
MEYWSAGLGDCTADGLRPRSKEFLLKNSPNSVNSASALVSARPRYALYTEYLLITLLVDLLHIYA